MSLPITNIVNISVATPPVGLADYQINNLAIFTKETPIDSSDAFAYRAYASPSDVAADWGSASEVYQMAVLVFGQSPNILTGSGQLLVFPMASGAVLVDAILAGQSLAFFGGALWAGYAPSDAEIIAAAETCQALKKLLFVSSNLVAAMNTGGLFEQIQSASLSYARMFIRTTGQADARIAIAAAASRLMSTDFNGSNTCQTMQMKDLAGVTADPGINQTIANQCALIGVDYYTKVGPLSKFVSTGGNDYSDNVYNTMWLAFALEVAGFNAIATASTKIPQTEPGMTTLKGAYIDVLNQAVRNGFIAPGSWKSSELFGNPEDLKTNVLNQGWYIYSQPVTQQLQAEREARHAPLIQIAVKFAGAIHDSDVVVFVNR